MKTNISHKQSARRGLAREALKLALERGEKYKRLTWRSYAKGMKTWRCYVCDKLVTNDNFTIAKYSAEPLGGREYINNLRIVCKECDKAMWTIPIEEYKAKWLETEKKTKKGLQERANNGRDFVDELYFDLKKAPALTMICGPNGSGKTRLLNRIMLENKKEHKVLYLDAMAPKTRTKKDAFMSTIELLMKYMLHELDGIKDKNTVVLIDNIGILDGEQRGQIFAELRDLCSQNRIWKAVVTRNGGEIYDLRNR
jgi:hypothetical protein